jgi:hypothetical protein
MTPSPDIHVCLDCGWSEFVIPRAWLSAGWLRSLRPQSAAPDKRTDTSAGTRLAPQIVSTAVM